MCLFLFTKNVIFLGLSGQEGRQAVMASDFALSRFKFIERLLLVHGHWCYDRLARMILYFFLKNAVSTDKFIWWPRHNMINVAFVYLSN